MKVKSRKIGGKKRSSGELDRLDMNEIKEKLLDYFKNGLPACDKKGHHVSFGAKFSPIQADIMDGILEKAPKGYWKNRSEMFRSAIAIFVVFSNWVFDQMEQVESLAEERRLGELIHQARKQARIDEVHQEAQSLLVAKNTKIGKTTKQFIEELERKFKRDKEELELSGGGKVLELDVKKDH